MTRGGTATLSLGITALGVVFGDIGTSPLYAIRVCFGGRYGVGVTTDNVMGVLSVVVWSLIVVICIKYLGVILRADNRGEGGILALLTLSLPKKSSGRLYAVVLVMGLFGSALLFGDGMITPAISVLSSIEGLSVAESFLTPAILPITAVVLFGLFALQRYGSGLVGRLFSPVMMLWFLVIAVLGGRWIVRSPRILAAVDPAYGVRFFEHNGLAGFIVLGAVFLVVTGGEALYADLGHFGRRPIRLVWFALVLPALLLNYFGQGAVLLSSPQAVNNPFYYLAPLWAVIPLVVLAASATVIASQAVISGVFSITRQAVQLGYLPRIPIIHSSEEHIGQIYVPSMNWALFISTVVIAFGFGTSDNLSGAYGVAVSATMAITTILAFRCAKDQWRWPLVATIPLFAAFFAIDIAFFASNLVKILAGGWLPVTVSIVVVTIMLTWRRGMAKLLQSVQAGTLSFSDFVTSIMLNPPPRVQGTAVYLGGLPYRVPRSTLHNLKHNKILHQWVFFLTVIIEEVPRTQRRNRVEVELLGHGFVSIRAHYGFMENPDLPRLMKTVEVDGWTLNPMDTSYFIGKDSIVITRHKGMARWRKQLFATLHHGIHQAPGYFTLPPGRVVELGAQIEL